MNLAQPAEDPTPAFPAFMSDEWLDMTDDEFMTWIETLPAVDSALRNYYDLVTYRDLACRLYRYYDAEGALLYIGITTDLCRRDRAHWVGSRWRQRAAFVLVENYPHARVAEAAEAQAIEDEKPPENRKWPAAYWSEFRCVPDEWWMKGRAGYRGDDPTWGIVAIGWSYFSPRVVPCPFKVTAEGVFEALDRAPLPAETSA